MRTGRVLHPWGHLGPGGRDWPWPRVAMTGSRSFAGWMFLALALAGGAAPVLAHKLQLFAFADGNRVEGSAYFSGGGGARGASIRVFDAENRLVADLQPDADGSFNWVAPSPMDYLLVAETGDGHRVEWRIGADELAPGFLPVQGAPPAAGVGPRGPNGAYTEPESNATRTNGAVGRPESPDPCAHDAVVDPALSAAIALAVARQVRPLREELAAERDRVRLQDILGGLGYIFGLAGIALWWRRRDGAGQ